MQNIRIEVTDKGGWHKEFVLQKAINFVGADEQNDLCLEAGHGAGVTPRNLEFILSGGACRLVNIGNTEISITTGVEPQTNKPQQVRPLAPLSTTEISHGSWIRLGDFTMRVYVADQSTAPPTAAPVTATSTQPAPAPVMASVSSQPPSSATESVPSFQRPSVAAPTTSPPAQPTYVTATPPPEPVTGASIGLRLKLDQTDLTVDNPLQGSVVVKNQGPRTGAQFKLDVLGIDPEFVEIGPGPILYPNAEREVPFVVKHSRKPTPHAGKFSIQIRATAPDAYPGQAAVVPVDIQVMPLYQHSLKLSIKE